MNEQWRRVIHRMVPLPYEVSDQGRVRRIPGSDSWGRVWPQMIMKQHFHRNGYKQLGLRWIGADGRKSKVVTVHQLVAFAFLGTPPIKYEKGRLGINHKNSIKEDNRASNLEWATCQQNSTHAMMNGLMLCGEKNGNSSLTTKDVLEIRDRFKNGESMRSLARSFNHSRCAIMSICKRLTWKHL